MTSESPLQLGSWLQTGSPIIAELADASGFDWLLIDLEHGCGTEANVLSQIQVIRHAAAIVRVGAPHPEQIARSLDWGAAGIMVPMVSTAEKAEACVRAMRYPPRGDRGLAGMVRGFQYGLTRDADACFLCRFETLAPPGCFPARVVRDHRGYFRVLTAKGELIATTAGRLKHNAQHASDLPAVGDFVALKEEREDGHRQGRGVIQLVMPRTTAFKRKAAGHLTEEQIVASNIDTVFIVCGLDSDYSPRRVERYLILARESGARAVVLLNKADKCADTLKPLSEVAVAWRPA